MNIIAVDDEAQALKSLVNAITKVTGEENLASFTSPREAMEYARNNIVDVAFLDIDMGEINGLFLAKQLKDMYGKTNIIFVTGYDQYAHNAFDLHVSGYVMKPINPSRVLEELEYLRNPVELPPVGVRFQCFGNFAVFVNDRPFLISRPKAKELLAYLVHKRGAAATSAEIASVLWEDKPYSKSVQSQVRTTIAQLIQILKDAGIKDIVQKGWNNIAVDVENVSCDYYEFLKGNNTSVNAYHGKYMEEYSWAEFEINLLNRNDK